MAARRRRASVEVIKESFFFTLALGQILVLQGQKVGAFSHDKFKYIATGQRKQSILSSSCLASFPDRKDPECLLFAPNFQQRTGPLGEISALQSPA